MKIENLKEGQIVSVVMTIGYAPNESEEFVELEYIIGTVRNIDTPNNLVQVTYSPDVFVLPQYIHGITISELVLKRLGWKEIEKEKIKVPRQRLSSIKTGYERGKYQVFQEYDGKFFYVRSASTPLKPIEYVHDLQDFGINDLDPSKLLNK